MGTHGPTGKRLAADAARLRCPVLFLMQWHDELVPRDAAIDLFDRIGSEKKALHANPGKHAAVAPEEFAHFESFLAQHLIDTTDHR